MWDPVSDVSEDELILNYTLIPLYLCNDNELDSESLASEYACFAVISLLLFLMGVLVCRCSNRSSCGSSDDVSDNYHYCSRLPG